MGENYIRVENITEEVDDEAKGVVTSAQYSIFIPGMGRRSVIGVLSTLLRHMEIDPLEIVAYRFSHDASRDHSHGIAVWPEALRRAAELGAKGNDNPSVSGGAADSPTPLSAACGGISPRRGESALCTREPLEDEE